MSAHFLPVIPTASLASPPFLSRRWGNGIFSAEGKKKKLDLTSFLEKLPGGALLTGRSI